MGRAVFYRFPPIIIIIIRFFVPLKCFTHEFEMDQRGSILLKTLYFKNKKQQVKFKSSVY